MKKPDENYKYIILIFKRLAFFVFSFLMVFSLLVFCTILFRSQELLASDVSNFIIPSWGNMVIKIINIATGDSLISSNDISYMSKLSFCMHFIGLIGVHFFLEKNKNG